MLPNLRFYAPHLLLYRQIIDNGVIDPVIRLPGLRHKGRSLFGGIEALFKVSLQAVRQIIKIKLTRLRNGAVDHDPLGDKLILNILVNAIVQARISRRRCRFRE